MKNCNANIPTPRAFIGDEPQNGVVCNAPVFECRLEKEWKKAYHIPTEKTRVYLRASPRSGTSFIKNVMRDVGIYSKHEAVSPDVTVNHLHWNEVTCGVRIHQTRDPRWVIPSLTRLGDIVIKDLGYFAGLSREAMRTLEGSACFWVLWNRNIEHWDPHFRYQIEQLSTFKVWQEWCMWIGRPDIPEYPNTKITNKGASHPWEDEQPLDFKYFGQWAGEVEKMAKRYGYDT